MIYCIVYTFKASPPEEIQWDVACELLSLRHGDRVRAISLTVSAIIFLPAIVGIQRWLRRLWSLVHSHVAACTEHSGTWTTGSSAKKLLPPATAQTVKKVSELEQVFLLTTSLFL